MMYRATAVSGSGVQSGIGSRWDQVQESVCLVFMTLFISGGCTNTFNLLQLVARVKQTWFGANAE